MLTRAEIGTSPESAVTRALTEMERAVLSAYRQRNCDARQGARKRRKAMAEAAKSALGHEIFHDFGELSCGDLTMALLKAIRPLPAETVMEVRALDPGAPIDIRAWCRLSGHTFLAGPCGPENAHYVIRKGGKP